MTKDVTDPLSKMYITSEDEMEQGVVGVHRHTLPTHYTFKINSFSSLSKNLDKYESREFDACGYKWKLLLYPNGNKKENVKDFISLYLVVVETNSLRPDWKLDVAFRFFLFDQLRDNYLVLGDLGGRARRFHAMKTECGFPQLIPLSILNDPSNGYLVEDTCVFGAEVFVCETTGVGECLSVVKEPITYKHTWKIERLSQIKEYVRSKVFATGGHRWQIQLYPGGYKEGVGTSIAIYLFMEDGTSLIVGQEVLTKFKLRIRSQTHEEHIEQNDTKSFSSQCLFNGFVHFMELAALHDPSKGFRVLDTCIVEAEVSILAVVDKLPRA